MIAKTKLRLIGRGPKGRSSGVVEARWQGLPGPTQVAIRFGKFNQTGNVWPDLSDNIALPLFLSNRLLNNHLTTWVEVLVFFIGVEVLVYITEKLNFLQHVTSGMSGAAIAGRWRPCGWNQTEPNLDAS